MVMMHQNRAPRSSDDPMNIQAFVFDLGKFLLDWDPDCFHAPTFGRTAAELLKLCLLPEI